MKTVLVTAIGSLAGGVVLENLKKAGWRVAACDLYPKAWLANAYDADVFFQAPPASEKEAYIAFLKEVCTRERVRFLVPLTDVEIDVLNENRAWFAQRQICLCLSPKEATALCRDKYRLMRFIEETGLVKTIDTVRLCDFDPTSARFPVVCKPVNGRSSQNVLYVQNPEDLARAAKNADQARYIVQPYVEGEIVTVDIVRQADGKRTAVLPRRELIRTPNGAGISVQVFTDAAFQKQCAFLADALGVVGCVNFEFIRDADGAYHFLECNPRFSGGVVFSALAGYDCVCNHMRCFEGEAIDPVPPFGALYVARRYEAYITETEN